MKLPVISGVEAVKAFRRMGYEFDGRKAATSSSGISFRRIGAFQFQIIKSLRKERFAR
jgi:hypothetical protein